MVEKDYVKAAKWFRKAAEHGHSQAQFKLGTMYADGRGVAKNYVDAYAWLYLADAQEYDRAAKLLGSLEKMMSLQQLTSALKRIKALKKLIAKKQAASKSEK